MKNIQNVKTICPLDCPDTCGVVARVEDGKVVALSGDSEHPYTNGFICKKMKDYPERLYSEKRITYPLAPVGKKGEGKFKRIGWDEALDICASRLLQVKKEFGGQAILPYAYAGNMGAISRFAGYPLFNKLGASQIKETICSAASGAGWKKQCGSLSGCPPENAADSELIIIWGINVKVSNVHFWQYVATARKNGAKVIVIDPYENQTAKAADRYVRVKVGGDSALALGILKVLLEKDGLDHDFIRSNTTGFEDLKSYLDQKSYDFFAGDSGVEESVIRSLAEQLTGCRKTFVRIGIGMSRNSRGAMSIRSITSLAAALGLFSGGAGRGVLYSSSAFKGDRDVLTGEWLRSEAGREINMIHLGYALTGLEDPVKALVVYNSNPVTVSPDSSTVRFGLSREDLFTVVHEQVMTPTAMYADIVLPATTFLENMDVYTAYGHFYMGVTRPVIPVFGEAKSNFDFFQKLALRCGFDEPVFKETCEERLRKYLATMQGIPEDVSIDDILDGALVHSTKSSADGHVYEGFDEKFQFALVDGTTDPATACVLPAGESADPDLLARFPLQLITPPHPNLLNSTFGEKYHGELGTVLINPVDARRFKVTDGDIVVLVNNRGRSRRVARVTEDTGKGVVVAEGLFWGEEDSSAMNAGGINDLTSQKITDMGEGATFHESRVTLMAS